MTKTRRLTDLYLVGKPLSFDDGTEGEEPIEVFIRKLNPVDHERAMRLANSARARTAVNQSDPESEDYQDVMGGLLEYTKEALVVYLVEEERGGRKAVVEAEIEAEEEWEEKDYLQGLRDVDLETCPEEEGNRVRAELARFDAKVKEELDARILDFEDDLEGKPVDVLRQMVFDKIYDIRTSMSWLTEYRRCEMWLSTRLPDKRTYYFEDRSEIDDLPLEVFVQLQAAYQDLTVDPTEGKDLGVTDTSLDSSDSPESPETEPPSSPSESPA